MTFSLFKKRVNFSRKKSLLEFLNFLENRKKKFQAMASLEDEQDVAAAKIATAEAGADKAEFDEAAKWAFLTSIFF